MANMTLIIFGMALLSAGTYLMRLGGAKLGSRLALSERSQALLSDAATVLLFSVALATTFYEGEHFAGRGVCRVSRLAKNAVNRGDYRGGGDDGAVASGGHKLKKRPQALFQQGKSLIWSVPRSYEPDCR